MERTTVSEKARRFITEGMLGLVDQRIGWREEKEERLDLIGEEKEMTIIVTVSDKRIRLWRKKSGPKPLPEGMKMARINSCLSPYWQ